MIAPIQALPYLKYFRQNYPIVHSSLYVLMDIFISSATVYRSPLAAVQNGGGLLRPERRQHIAGHAVLHPDGARTDIERALGGDGAAVGRHAVDGGEVDTDRSLKKTQNEQS